MWSSNRITPLLLLSFLTFFANGQTCDLIISGKVVDDHHQEGMSNAVWEIQEIGRKGVTNLEGGFRADNLCPGDYHLSISHIGCARKVVVLKLRKDTTILIQLTHDPELLEEVVLHSEEVTLENQAHQKISKVTLDRKGNLSLAQITDGVSGVDNLKTGSGINKPVIHGLYGNRVAILNNGVEQAGQQWGNDHAPEIDPAAADKIVVVKGTSALRYSGNSLGGVILVKPSDIFAPNKLSGRVNGIFESNGWGGTLSARLERKEKGFSWRTTASVKGIGDRQTPDYYLTNTGVRESNFAVQFERKRNKWTHQGYYSLFHTRIGILRGSHIGNITDLNDALSRDVPLFTSPNFSYEINAPAQRVTHHLLKWKTDYLSSAQSKWSFTYAGQLNNRAEFDVRRGGRSDIPALSLLQGSHFLEVFNTYAPNNNVKWENGVQYRYIDNTNNPETGILPLIPDYQSFSGSVFSIFKYIKNAWRYEFGARYNLRDLYVLKITDAPPYEVEQKDHLFHNFSFSGSAQYHAKSHWTLLSNLGVSSRAPEINELYSQGLHQGVGAIEEGNPDLIPETGIKYLMEWRGSFDDDWSLLVSPYAQYIQNFIFLEPQDKIAVTIRGAFPVFIYNQTDAFIYGIDGTLIKNWSPSWKTSLSGAYLRGENLSQNLPLIFMPAPHLKGLMHYHLDSKWGIEEISLSGRYQFEQKNYQDGQDYLAPPEGYFLLGLQIHGEWEIGDQKWNASLRVDNLLNTTYRDYLNRQRYFADDLGINVQLQVGYQF